jgi:hypothetical protein
MSRKINKRYKMLGAQVGMCQIYSIEKKKDLWVMGSD